MGHPFEAYRQRRGLFDTDVDTYALGRPGYPERVYELLVEHCGLTTGTEVIEIGPGTGQATRRLLELGASVTAIELGEGFAVHLRAELAGPALSVVLGAFEDTDLAPASADLLVAATSFHWVPTQPGLQRCAKLLRSGGWLALWWSSFGDPYRPDPFHEALLPLLAEHAPSVLDVPSAGVVGSTTPYALDVDARVAEIDATGSFGEVIHEVIAWTGRHTSTEIRAMFASFSPWLALPADQRRVALDALEALANDEFEGIIERPYLTSIYLAQRLTQR